MQGYFFMLKTAFCLLLTGFATSQAFAQSSKPLPAIEQKMVDRGLVDIQKVDPEILVELKYSTTDNFIGRDVYGELTRAYLQPEMAKRLAKANAILRKEKPGYHLLVYDAARPNSAQYDLWNALDHLKIPARSKTQYVADPKIGSNHNFGCAIDLTVVDENGKPLDMGTKFDFFGPPGLSTFRAGNAQKRKTDGPTSRNRQLLRKVMTQVGFKVNTTEWWHFDGMSKAQARAKYGMIP